MRTPLAIAASAVVWSVAWAGHAQSGDAGAPDAATEDAPSGTPGTPGTPSTESPSTESPSTESPSTESPSTRTPEASADASTDESVEVASPDGAETSDAVAEPPSTPREPEASEPPANRPSRGPNHVVVHRDAQGFKLRVDGRDFMVFGMNWDFFPIGENYSYDFWRQPDDFIREALDYEMGLMRDMGVNAIRVYVGIPKRFFFNF